jgi:hypothetical protein
MTIDSRLMGINPIPDNDRQHSIMSDHPFIQTIITFEAKESISVLMSIDYPAEIVWLMINIQFIVTAAQPQLSPEIVKICQISSYPCPDLFTCGTESS